MSHSYIVYAFDVYMYVRRFAWCVECNGSCLFYGYDQNLLSTNRIVGQSSNADMKEQQCVNRERLAVVKASRTTTPAPSRPTTSAGRLTAL